MRQKAAFLLAILFAVHTPLAAAASAVGVAPFSAGSAYGQAGTETEALEADAATGKVLDTLDLRELKEETEKASPSDAEKATPSDADAENGISLMSLVPTGNLKINVRGVVASKESSWNITLYRKNEHHSGEEQAAAFEAEQASYMLELPARGDGDDYEQASILLTDIPVGDYTLQMSPLRLDSQTEAENSYVVYEQDITIGEDVTTLSFLNDKPEDHGYGETDAEKFGVLIMGDITNDGALNEDDEDIMMDILASVDYPQDDYYESADLNGDGEVNLLDMAAFVRYYKNDLTNAKGYPSRLANPAKSALIRETDVTASPSDATRVEGSMAALLAGEEGAFLKLERSSEGGEDKPLISEEHPVEIAAEFEEAKKMDGFVIDPVPGSASSIRDGQITVEDSEGKQYVFDVHNGVAVLRSQAAEKAGRSVPQTAGENSEETLEEVLTGAGESFLQKAFDAIRSVFGSFAMTVFAAETDGGSEAPQNSDEEMLQGVPVVIDLGGQVPVKKITIKVTKTLKETSSLAEISKVEFYDHMADRIPEAPMSSPERVVVENGSESFTVSWKNMPNVESYEVKVTGDAEGKPKASQIFEVRDGTVREVTSLDGSDLVNGNKYTVEVYSVNGEWRSKPTVVYGEPVALSLPPAPENLVIKAGFRHLAISWKDMKDTDSYTLYYRKAARTAAEISTREELELEGYTAIPDIEGTSYTLEGLTEDTEYEICMTGTNAIGEGPASLPYRASTTTLNPPVTPNYKLLNVPVEGQTATAHIASVNPGTGKSENEFDVVDDAYDTVWFKDDWDVGFHYGQRAPRVTFDQEYKMDTFVLIPDDQQPYSFSNVRVDYWSEGEDETNDNAKHKADARLTRKTSNGKYYYVVETYEPINAKTVQIALCTYGSGRMIRLAEIKYYYYDPIEDDIFGLFEDDYHVVLRSDVTQDTIDELRKRLNVPDSVSGELHPKLETLERELENAEKILADQSLQKEILPVDNKDTSAYDGHITFRGGLNTYQPLGVTALAGDTLTVYVGGPRCQDGETTRLRLIMSQYHGSSAAVFLDKGYLKVGANEITVEALDNMDLERGGQLYVEYVGNYEGETYGVRVSGGRKTAVLDLSDLNEETDTEKRVELAREYLTKLIEQKKNVKALHDEDHSEKAYELKNCIYEGTDIITRYGMISTAANQVLAGLLGKGDEDISGDLDSIDLDAMAAKLEQSMKAFDEMMVLFYQHKGLSEDPKAPASNRMPVSRINIRYQRMFAGAFMYAGGKHIGIEWPELKGMMGGVPMKLTEDGGYDGVGQYFGWGIAHEIGHEINEGAYAVAEVTNNYFSILAQAHDDNETVRYKYDDVFKKVTSGVKGKASNVFVRLAMYWQLHLAYDLGGYNYKTFDTNEEQLANLIFGRMDSYARNLKSVPIPESLKKGKSEEEIKKLDNPLVIKDANADNALMRLAMAAAQKNLLKFFERWGLEPDAGTKAYAELFPEETKGIWFANDETRARQLEAIKAGEQEENAADAVTVGGSISYEKGSNQVTLDLNAGDSGESIWMYEIYRYERVKDQIIGRPVGYVQAENGEATFVDVVGTVNNRAFTYKAIGYDMWLNPTAETEIGEVKVSHDGELDKSLWTITTNLTNEGLEGPNEDHPDTSEQPGVEDMIDKDAEKETSFTGRSPETADPEIIINLNQEETITGLKYMAAGGTPIGAFEVYVSETGEGGWTKVTTTETEFSLTDGSQTIWFHDDKKLYTYDASYVKLTAPGQAGTDITVTELSLLGQTGDNVELDANGIGTLASDYVVSGTDTIPEGSLVFTGTYKGNPAFNAVQLWDEDGNLVGGTDAKNNLVASQIIYAPDPGEKGLLGEVSDGIWVYYIDKAHLTDDVLSKLKGKKVRAELYRVDDAMTMEGERLVSSTMFVTVPETLGTVVIQQGSAQGGVQE